MTRDEVVQDILQNQRLRGSRGAYGEGVWAYQLGPGEPVQGGVAWPHNPLAPGEILFTPTTDVAFTGDGPNPVQLHGPWGGPGWNAAEGRFLVDAGDYMSVEIIAGPGDCWEP